MSKDSKPMGSKSTNIKKSRQPERLHNYRLIFQLLGDNRVADQNSLLSLEKATIIPHSKDEVLALWKRLLYSMFPKAAVEYERAFPDGDIEAAEKIYQEGIKRMLKPLEGKDRELLMHLLLGHTDKLDKYFKKNPNYFMKWFFKGIQINYKEPLLKTKEGKFEDAVLASDYTVTPMEIAIQFNILTAAEWLFSKYKAARPTTNENKQFIQNFINALQKSSASHQNLYWTLYKNFSPELKTMFRKKIGPDLWQNLVFIEQDINLFINIYNKLPSDIQEEFVSANGFSFFRKIIESKNLDFAKQIFDKHESVKNFVLENPHSYLIYLQDTKTADWLYNQLGDNSKKLCADSEVFCQVCYVGNKDIIKWLLKKHSELGINSTDVIANGNYEALDIVCSVGAQDTFEMLYAKVKDQIPIEHLVKLLGTAFREKKFQLADMLLTEITQKSPEYTSVNLVKIMVEFCDMKKANQYFQALPASEKEALKQYPLYDVFKTALKEHNFEKAEWIYQNTYIISENIALFINQLVQDKVQNLEALQWLKQHHSITDFLLEKANTSNLTFKNVFKRHCKDLIPCIDTVSELVKLSALLNPKSNHSHSLHTHRHWFWQNFPVKTQTDSIKLLKTLIQEQYDKIINTDKTVTEEDINKLENALDCALARPSGKHLRQ